MRHSLRLSRAVLAIVLAAVLTLAATILDSSPATAASGPRLTISKIAAKTVPYGGTVTVTTNVNASGNVEVAKTSLTVKKGSRTVAKGKPSATLPTGTYSVVQPATYRTFTIAPRTGKKTYSAYKTKTATQKLVLRQGAKPTRVAGGGGYDCPGGYPVKGNADSMIYHVPDGSYYSRTKPEECFITESAARAAGYRASQR